MNKSIDFEKWKFWWRSRTPEEKDSGLSAWLDKVTPICCITVPVPFCGVIEVFITSMRGRKQFQVKVSKRALIQLRDLFLCPSQKKWTVKKDSRGIHFLHGGELRRWNDLRGAGRF